MSGPAPNPFGAAFFALANSFGREKNRQNERKSPLASTMTTATKLTLAFAAIAIAGALAALLRQQQIQSNLRAENESLQRQIAQFHTDTQNFSNQIAETENANRVSANERSELLRLRGQVAVLQGQLADAGTLRDQNQQLQEANTQLQSSNARMELTGALEKFKDNEAQVIDTMKQICLAARIYSAGNNEQYPTGFDQMTNELGGLYNSPLLENIEFVNVGIASEQVPYIIAFREHSPRHSPDGPWHRVYGLADGHVQVAASPDGNFSAWERYNPNSKGIYFSPPNQNQ